VKKRIIFLDYGGDPRTFSALNPHVPQHIISPVRVIDVTPHIPKHCTIAEQKELREKHIVFGRGLEIQTWLDMYQHEIESFVAIDDETWDMLELKQFTVKTKMDIGIQDDDVEKAISILRGEHGTIE